MMSNLYFVYCYYRMFANHSYSWAGAIHVQSRDIKNSYKTKKPLLSGKASQKVMQSLPSNSSIVLEDTQLERYT